MKQLKYDVAVIGGGLGGLTTAALLAKAVFNTLVAEKLPFTVGRCGTLNHHGYKLRSEATGCAALAKAVVSAPRHGPAWVMERFQQAQRHRLHAGIVLLP
mgnify:CR=1 FL=1